ncbi:MAG: pitrilysin family protein [Vicinamibacterales bacterium]
MAVDRTTLPPLGPLPEFHFPEVRRTALANGLRIWTIEQRAVPLVSALLLLRRGSASDPEDRAGLAAITGDLLDEGCGELDALALHEALGRIGGQIDTEVGADATMLGLSVLKRFSTRGFALLADMMQRPRFERSDFERVRDLRLNRLVQIRDMPPALADRAFTELLYRGHPYGHLAIGREESLRQLSLEAIRHFHREAYAPAGATIIAAGDASHEELVGLISDAFGTWAGEDRLSTPERAMMVPPPPPPARLALLHRAGAGQSELRIGHVSIARSAPDYPQLLVLNMVLGGQFVSRINMNLREEKGYTYGARTSFDARRGPGPFVLQASVQSDATADAIREGLREVDEIRGARPVTGPELETGRAALTRGFARNFETAEQAARAAAQMALHDLPDDYYGTFVPRILAIDETEVTAAASRHLHPDQMLTVVVGDREKIGTSLEALGFGTPMTLEP